MRVRAFCVTTVIELSLYSTSPFTTGTDILVFTILKLVDSWGSLVVQTAKKGLMFHLCWVELWEVNPWWLFAFTSEMTTTNSPGTLSCKCSLIDKGSAGGGSPMSHGMAFFCKMQLDSKSRKEIQLIVLFCSWKEKTRSNKHVTELRCVPVSFAVVDTPNSVAFPLRQWTEVCKRQ